MVTVVVVMVTVVVVMVTVVVVIVTVVVADMAVVCILPITRNLDGQIAHALAASHDIPHLACWRYVQS